MTTSIALDELTDQIGIQRGPSTSRLIDQARIDAFAAATNDEQWIHLDPARAAQSPFGGTIAHGFLTLSMLSSVMDELVIVDGASHAINYGLNRVRFLTPVRSGSELHGRVTITDVRPQEAHVDMTAKVELIAGEHTLACVAESLTRYIRGASV